MCTMHALAPFSRTLLPSMHAPERKEQRQTSGKRSPHVVGNKAGIKVEKQKEAGSAC